jgi:hypothetical protein
MQADFIISAIVPTTDGKEEIYLTPISEDTETKLTTLWILTPPHGLKRGEEVTVEQLGPQS